MGRARMQDRKKKKLLIEDYALIGDCKTAALVGKNGSIDWLCWPRFDSSACFTSLLGEEEHGRWIVAPKDHPKAVKRHYIDGSLILVTTFETESGKVELIDFMPPRDGTNDLVRIVRGIEGKVAIATEVILRFEYGSVIPWVEQLDHEGIRAIAGPDLVLLRTPVPLQGKGMTTVGEFEVSAGDSIPFVMSYGPSNEELPKRIDPEQAMKDTESYWRSWSDKCAPAGEWTDEVKRSLTVLKGLTYRPTGGIVAAPTTSLPEQAGGVRNWDYRYCWLRDATLTLFALGRAGFFTEAQEWRDWLMRAVAGSPDQIQIMYGISGERRLSEWEVEWLPGYEGARPVRIGNAAATQLQLDVYGEIAGAMYEAAKNGMAPAPRWDAISRSLLGHLEKIWRDPDEGIWEVRGGPRHFVHSKIMAWLAFDRGVAWSESIEDSEAADRWRAVRDEIHREVCEKGFDPELNSFVQSYGSSFLDASLLMMPLVGFLPASDPRVKGTVDAIDRKLRRNGLVYRYQTEESVDGLPPNEAAFLACSFWYVDNLALQDRLQEARDMFKKLLSLCNDVGLLAEEYDPEAKRQMGNFPQAFSHVSLVNTAYRLANHASEARDRGNRDFNVETVGDPHERASQSHGSS
jgi:GH15 family glucan-1,4-alpha-glucosidase